MIYTKRLILRPWNEDDAPALFKYASDENVADPAGWPAHKSVEESKNVIKDVFSAKNTFAVCLRESGEPIGCIGLMTGEAASIELGADEAEIGYWLGAPFWGRGLMTEAANAIIDYGFEMLGLKCIKCGYFDGNARSYGVQKKCGFVHSHTVKDAYWALTDKTLTEHITVLTRDNWEKIKKHQNN